MKASAQLRQWAYEFRQLAMWLSGANAGETFTFGTSSIQSQQLANSQAVAEILSKYLNYRILAGPSPFDTAANVVAASSNATMQFVGGFDYSLFTQGILHIAIWNTTGRESFSRILTHLGQEPYPDIVGLNTGLSNVIVSSFSNHFGNFEGGRSEPRADVLFVAEKEDKQVCLVWEISRRFCKMPPDSAGASAGRSAP